MVKAWLFGDDADHASGGVLAKQSPLGSPQDFDAVQLAQITKADTISAAKHAIHKNAYGAFQARIIPHGADPADPRGGDKFTRGGGDHEPRGNIDQVLYVLHARIFQLRRAQCRHGDGHVLDTFGALGGGHGDHIYLGRNAGKRRQGQGGG